MSSIAGLADPGEKVHKKSFHRRNDSGELDVFEAARYFSGYNEAPTMMMKEDRSSWRGGRISLDMPIRNVLDQQLHHHHHHHHAVDQKQNMKEKIKYKQPSSPGGRLASFLNSLFNQSGSKKKKSKSSTTQSMKDEEESPGGRRRRRSSISHFRSSSTTTTTDAKSIYSSSSSGFRTPPPYGAQIATAKSYKDWRSYSDHKPQQQVVSNLSKHSVLSHAKSTLLDEKVSSNRELNWLDEKFKYNNRLSLSEKYKNSIDQDHNKGLLKRLSEVVDDDDDGAESDSSSDLFELQNYDLGGYYSSGLPVYETTNVDSIKNIRGTPIANAS
ncbi:protein BIG GRAIN 1-like E [Rosa rugosa]|uniref:protein BIG GRAIN 1-like E n=1 Tax=Rosa rugosa TaxID=74645 RepID=UPI002B407790|nr:protein BIG GRAIN 1-like E [Rosa rugosa]